MKYIDTRKLKNFVNQLSGVSSDNVNSFSKIIEEDLKKIKKSLLDYTEIQSNSIDLLFLLKIYLGSLYSGKSAINVYESNLISGRKKVFDFIYQSENRNLITFICFRMDKYQDFYLKDMKRTASKYFDESTEESINALPDDNFKKQILSFQKGQSKSKKFILVCNENVKAEKLNSDFGGDSRQMEVISLFDFIKKSITKDFDYDPIEDRHFKIEISFLEKQMTNFALDENQRHFFGLANSNSFVKQFGQLNRYAIDSLFTQNIRNLVVNKKFKKEIWESVSETPDFFHLFNNGITIVTEEKIIPHERNTLLEIYKPNIVNGQQTLRTLLDLYHENPDAFPEFKIPLKIIQIMASEGKELINRIAECLNNQTAIKKSELSSTKVAYQKISELAKKNGFSLIGKKGKLNTDKYNSIFVNKGTIKLNEIIRCHAAAFFPEEFIGDSKNKITQVVARYFSENGSSYMYKLTSNKEDFAKVIDAIQYYNNTLQRESRTLIESYKIAKIPSSTYRPKLNQELNYIKFGISIIYYLKINEELLDPLKVTKYIYEKYADRNINLFKKNEKTWAALNNAIQHFKEEEEI